MKTVATATTHQEITVMADRLKLRGMFNYVFGCKARGYEVMVNDRDEELAKATLGTANGIHAAQSLSPEATV
jgi:hypothetical protein